MATTQTLIDRVRMELGDTAKSFVERLYPDGTTNRFQLSYNPVDGASVQVSVDGTDVTADTSVEESTGVLVLDDIPAPGSVLIANGTHYRYFKDSEILSFVETALGQHTAKRVDSLGRTVTISNLPALEEYPVALYATTLALYTLATDASFDIDISAPDGVMIPRAQRYRQLMDMIQTRKEQYRELCTQLGIGMYSIDVFSLRRISKTTNRYVPVYKPQEVDDKSVSQRVELSNPTYGDANVAWPTENGQLTSYQDIEFSANVTFTGNYAGDSFIARLVTQRGSIQVVRNFDVTVTSAMPSSVITAVSRTSGNAATTLTTSNLHTFTAGNTLVVTGLDDYGLATGSYVVSSVPSTTSVVVLATVTTAAAFTGLTGQADKSADYEFTATLELSRDSTLRLPSKCWYQVLSVDPITGEEVERVAGDFFSRKSYTAIL